MGCISMQLNQFFFDTPLYSPVILGNENQFFIEQLNKDFEGINPFKKLDSTFKKNSITFKENVIRAGYPPILHYIEQGGFATIEIQCKRYHDFFLFHILWQPDTKTLIKIGQYPSVADFHTSQVKQYAKLLKKEEMQEFTKAIGLAAHGVGIGSFVYLRRIFENLIQDAYEEALAADTIVNADFQIARMDEKIQLLKGHLPEFLVEHKTLYSILSLGIHSLDETTCLAHFDIVRTGIEIILDEKLEAQRKQEKIAEASKKIKALPSQLKNG